MATTVVFSVTINESGKIDVISKFQGVQLGFFLDVLKFEMLNKSGIDDYKIMNICDEFIDQSEV